MTPTIVIVAPAIAAESQHRQIDRLRRPDSCMPNVSRRRAASASLIDRHVRRADAILGREAASGDARGIPIVEK